MARKIAERLGFHLVPRHYFSPIPDLAELSPAIWERRSDLAGIEADPAAQLELLEGALHSYVAAFTPPAGFHYDNGSYGSVDAEVLYAMARHFRPRRLIEIGSGYSTLVSAAAARANEREGHPTEIVAVDPYPSRVLLEHATEPVRLRRMRAEDVPLEEFTSLAAGDVLFVDGTHTVKLGSDVNFIVLDLLPRLRAGVLVHFHDIFLPFEYPREWMEHHAYFWNEQYLLQAFLALNGEYEILFAAHWLARQYPDRLAAAVPSYRPDVRPSAFWLRRR